MHHVLIMEEDTAYQEILKEAIAAQYPDWKVYVAEGYDAAIDLIRESVSSGGVFSLFLLGVCFSENYDRSGFRIAQRIREVRDYYATPIIFLTSLEEERGYALSEFHCYDYICKPYNVADILRRIEQMLETGYLKHTIEIMDISRIRHRIDVNDIIVVKSRDHVLTIITERGQCATRMYTLNQLLDLLGDPFIRCHRQYIINRERIMNYDRTMHTIHADSIRIPVGRAYHSSLSEYI